VSFKIHLLEPEFKNTISAFESLTNHVVNTTLLSQVIRCELSNLRAGNAHTKNRGEVSGGGKKPWKQKGTGRARHGSSRSPLWVGGGVTFGPRNTRNWHRDINKTSRIAALRSIIKDRLDEATIFQFGDNFDFPKTKNAVEILNQLETKTGNKVKSTIIFYTTEDKINLNGFPNTDVKMINAANLKIHTIAAPKNWIMTPSALALLEEKVSPKTNNSKTEARTESKTDSKEKTAKVKVAK